MPYKDKEKEKENRKKYRENNKRKGTQRWTQIKHKYNLTKEEYENLLKDQNFSCVICQRHISELSRNLVVDHCHNTNKIRGLLCYSCNLGIGLFKDDPKILSRARAYLT